MDNSLPPANVDNPVLPAAAKTDWGRRFFWLLAALLFSFVCIFAYNYLSPTILGGTRIATLDSPWGGKYTRSPYSLKAAGSHIPTVLYLPVSLVPNSRYDFAIAANCKSQIKVDFYAPGYGGAAKQFSIDPEFNPTVIYRFHLDSGDLPAAAFLRIFFQSPEDATISHFSGARVTDQYRAFRVLLLISAVVSLLAGLWMAVPLNAFVAGALTAGVFGVYFFIADIPAASQTGDNMWYIPTTNSLLARGTLSLPEEILQVPKLDQRWMLFPYNGELLSFRPIGTSIVSMPFVAVAHLLHMTDWDTAENLAKFYAALSVAFLFLLLRRFEVGLSEALAVSLLFGLGSTHFSTHAGGLWSHNTSLMFSLLYLLFLTDKRTAFQLCAAPVGVLGYLCRPEFSLFILAGIGYLLFVRPRLVPRFIISLGLAGAPLIIWSLATFGALRPPYEQLTDNHLIWGWRILKVMAAHFFSPNRGLLIFNPFLLLAIAGTLLSFLRPIKDRRLFQMLSIACALHILAISAFDNWWAGHSFGPRYFTSILGLLFVLTIPVWRYIKVATPAVRKTVVLFAIITGCWGMFVHYRGATSPSTSLWNNIPEIEDHPAERVWDWKDMQIFRRAAGAHSSAP